MNMPIEKLMERLASIPEYKPLFATAFPSEGMKSDDACEGDRNL